MGGIHEFAKRDITSGGEVNNGANVGAGTGLIFENKTGVDLNFRSLVEGSLLDVATVGSDIILSYKDHYTSMFLTGAPQSFTAVLEKMSFNSALGEIANFDNVNDRLIAPATGTYEINYACDFDQNGADMTTASLFIFKNGGGTGFNLPFSDMVALGFTKSSVGGIATLQLNLGDYVEGFISSNIVAGSFRTNVTGQPIISFRQVA